MCLGRIQEPCEFVLFLNQDSHIASDFNNVERNGRVSTVKSGKIFFQGQGIVREF